MRALWRRTRAAIDLYVQQYASNGALAVREIERLYSRFDVYASCDELEKAFHKRANHISELYRARGRAIQSRTGSGREQFPDLSVLLSVQTPIAGSPDEQIDGWCQMSDDLETVQQGKCRLDRSCDQATAFCTIDYTWRDERIRVLYEDGEPVSWNDGPAGYAFINKTPCVRSTSDSRIFCFFKRELEGRWFNHLP